MTCRYDNDLASEIEGVGPTEELLLIQVLSYYVRSLL
jgi:hypothetical protein